MSSTARPAPQPADGGQAGRFPWLVADIGGTHARFGLVNRAGGPVEHIAKLDCATFESLQQAAADYLQRRQAAPGRAAFAVATAVQGERFKLTNNAWSIEPAQVQRALAAPALFINDFEALALALPGLPADQMSGLGGPPCTGAARRTPMAVIGPGTGLGVAGCVPAGRHWIALATEGGHATLSAADDDEAALLQQVRRDLSPAADGTAPHVSAERLLSGTGLPLLHRALGRLRGEDPPLEAAERISAAGLAGTDTLCVQALDVFCAMLGGFAGNVALTLGARGGVFLAGGVAHTLAPLLPRSRFRARFDAKGRFRTYLAGIGTALITAPFAALQGAALALQNEDAERLSQ
jgi:glucokinase